MKLKSIGALLLSGVMMFAACDKYDDTALTGRVDDLEGRVTELEKLVADLNTTVSGLSTIVSAMENEDRIQSIVPLKEGETVIGYEITFSKSGKIQILNGKAPSLGVKDEGGILYWTVNGEFLLDSSSNKIPATIAPEFRVENGELQYRINGGEWQTMPGSANIGLIKEVQDGAESVTFILSDGTEITIPKVQSFALELDVEDIEIGIMPGQRMSIDYTVISGDENTLVKAISEGGYTVTVNASDATKGYLSIETSAEDRRCKQIHVTTRALEANQQVLDQLAASEQQLVSDMSGAEIAQLKNLLDKMILNLSASNSASQSTDQIHRFADETERETEDCGC